MDPLQQLVETLRVSARTNEPNRVALIEKAVNEYLNDKAGIARLSLERLCNAIDREEAEKRGRCRVSGASCARRWRATPYCALSAVIKDL
jgi:hypothetical protein